MTSIKLTDINFDNLGLEELDALIKDLDTPDGANRELVSMLRDIANDLHREAYDAKMLDRMVQDAEWEVDSLEWTNLDELDNLADWYTEKQDSKEFWELCEDYQWSDLDSTYYVVKKELAKSAIRSRIWKNPLRALTCPLSALF